MSGGSLPAEVSEEVVTLLMGDITKMKHPPKKRKKRHLKLVLELEDAKRRGASSWTLELMQARLKGFREGIAVCTTMSVEDLKSEAEHFMANLTASKVNSQKEAQRGAANFQGERNEQSSFRIEAGHRPACGAVADLDRG